MPEESEPMPLFELVLTRLLRTVPIFHVKSSRAEAFVPVLAGVEGNCKIFLVPCGSGSPFSESRPGAIT